MSIEAQLASLEVAIKENTAALNAVLAASGSTPSNVVPITAEAPKPAKKVAKTAPAATPEPEPVTETPTKVDAPAPESDEFSDPLDPDTKVVVQGDPAPSKIDVDAVILDCTTSFKSHMAAASDNPERKAYLKEKFAELRTKYGMAPDTKLISLAPTPEKLVGLLSDIKAL